MTTTAPIEPRTLRFVEPLPGLDSEFDFTLSAIDPRGVLFSMRSVGDPGLRLVLSPASCFFEDYAPDLEAVVTTALDLADDAEITVLLVLTIPGDLTDATANLRAPVVVDNVSGRAVQIVLDDESLSMRRPLGVRSTV